MKLLWVPVRGPQVEPGLGVVHGELQRLDFALQHLGARLRDKKVARPFNARTVKAVVVVVKSTSELARVFCALKPFRVRSAS